ncbi:MAG: hypothetical protein M9962_02650 [Oligoflexia bacterium]|nr:hypothetical protein [Oligoflexia bacterium]
MKYSMLLLALSFLPYSSLAAPTILYIDIADCKMENQEEGSFKIMVNGNTADQVGSSEGILVFSAIPHPEYEDETITMAASTTVTKKTDGTYELVHMFLSPEDNLVKIIPGKETKKRTPNGILSCKGKRVE